MDLDFKSNKYDLFDDWHQNKTKQAFTQKLQQQAQIEKTHLPKLLSALLSGLYLEVFFPTF